MENIRTGLMRTYDEALEMRKNYEVCRNRAIAEAIIHYAQFEDKTFPIAEIARRAGVSCAVIRNIFRGDRYNRIDLWADKSGQPSLRLMDTDYIPKFLCSYRIHWRRDEITTRFAAVDEHGVADLNNTITKKKYTYKMGFIRE